MKLRFQLDFNELSDQFESIRFGTVNSTFTIRKNRECNQYSLSRQNLKLKSLIMAQIERWRQA